MSERAEQVEILQQLLDECAVAAGAYTTWPELPARIRALAARVAELERERKELRDVFVAERKSLKARIAELERETKRLQDREDHYAGALRVADGGAYRNDWDAAIQRVLRERNEDRARVAELERERDEADREARRERNRTAASVLGGMVEGAPTSEVNWIQRARELVQKEARVAELEALRPTSEEVLAARRYLRVSEVIGDPDDPANILARAVLRLAGEDAR